METGEASHGGAANYEGINEQQALLLDLAAERLLELGKRAGITPDQIATMLNSGMKLEELIRHLVSKLDGCKND